MNTDERTLTEKIRKGDAQAFKDLFFLYSGRLGNWAYKITNDRCAAEDIIQDFFIRYWERKETLEFNPSFRSYAYRAVYNASLNYLRDNERFVYGYEDLFPHLVEKEGDEKNLELQNILSKAINELPTRCKDIFVMVALEKKKHAEVAEQLGISVNTVKVQVSKAYRILRSKVGLLPLIMALIS